MGKIIELSKPYVAMIFLQFGFAGMNIISKVSLNGGMNHFVLVVYRYTVATVVLSPFAFFVERKVRPKLTFTICCQFFALGLLGTGRCDPSSLLQYSAKFLDWFC
jgi:hypothetical protein